MAVENTPAVDNALRAAGRQARLQGASAVEPAHLLQVLLAEEEGRPWLLLLQAGLDPEQARQRIPALETYVAPEGEAPFPLGAAVETILVQARRLAREISADGQLASHLLLLALLRLDEPSRQALEALGLVFGRLEEQIDAMQPPPLQLEEPLHLEEITEQIDTARMLDASANRAREALRVLEDYVRFVLDDAFLSGELKRLRHDLAAALGEVPDFLLLEGRETLQDVGTALSTPQEEVRYGLFEVVQANCKRLQEALRTLEELGKLRGRGLGQTLQGLRYRAYTLERAILLGGSVRERLRHARLYVLLTGSGCWGPLEWTVRAIAEGGAQIIQLREKGLADGALLERARQVRRWTRELGLLFIMNDRPDLARLAEADGVHLGQDELSVKDARRIVGPDALIGVSTHNLKQVRQAVLDGASYIGVGPTFPSGTKEFAEFPGLEFVRQATAATSLPAFAIGGIHLQNLEQVIAAGARRVAVSQAVCGAEAPQAVAAAMRQLLDRA